MVDTLFGPKGFGAASTLPSAAGARGIKFLATHPDTMKAALEEASRLGSRTCTAASA